MSASIPDGASEQIAVKSAEIHEIHAPGPRTGYGHTCCLHLDLWH